MTSSRRTSPALTLESLPNSLLTCLIRGGTVESRIRTLIQDLENTENIVTAHPHVNSISNSFVCLSEEEQAAASQGELSGEAMKRKEEDVAGQDFKRIWTKSFFIGLEVEKKTSSKSTVACIFTICPFSPHAPSKGGRRRLTWSQRTVLVVS